MLASANHRAQANSRFSKIIMFLSKSLSSVKVKTLLQKKKNRDEKKIQQLANWDTAVQIARGTDSTGVSTINNEIGPFDLFPKPSNFENYST